MNSSYIENLILTACNVRNNAQAPYSNYFVGAAVLSENGDIYGGCNVERCSYTQTTHAEQNAIDSMVAAEGPVKIAALAVVAALQGISIKPENFEKHAFVHDAHTRGCCGHCLQIIWENCNDDASVPLYFLKEDGKIYQTTIGTVFPYPFGPRDIYKK